MSHLLLVTVLALPGPRAKPAGPAPIHSESRPELFPAPPPSRNSIPVARYGHGDRVASHAFGGLFFAGIGLVALGLVAGGAGWIVLGLCDKPADTTEFGECRDPNLEILGWVLAAPGILPLAVGGFLIYISVNATSSAALPADPSRRYARTAVTPTWGLGVKF